MQLSILLVYRLDAHCLPGLCFLFVFSFAETGQALVSSVDKIIFVGSPGVGKMVYLSSEVGSCD
jgi:acyl-CoA reductase-like NAD-dependent aldehyde dehydrogenase